MAAPIPVAILVRVSTARQVTDRQVSELTRYANAEGYEVVEVCEETVSGRADEDSRTGLRRIEELAAAGKIRKVLVHEISRLARRNSIVHRFVEKLEEHRVSLYWHSQGVETLQANGKPNPAARMMLALLAEIARNEVEVLRERIRSGLGEARRKGVKLGRPHGTKEAPEDLIRKHDDIVRQLRAGQSIRNVAARTRKAASTVQRVKRAITQQTTGAR